MTVTSKRMPGAQNPQTDFALHVSRAKREDLDKRVLGERRIHTALSSHI